MGGEPPVATHWGVSPATQPPTPSPLLCPALAGLRPRLLAPSNTHTSVTQSSLLWRPFYPHWTFSKQKGKKLQEGVLASRGGFQKPLSTP